MMMPTTIARFALAALAFGLLGSPLHATSPNPAADADWKALLAMDAGPREPASSRDQARTTALAFLTRQESALRQFVRNHPQDPRAIDAQLRLAHLLAMKGDFSESPALYAAAIKLLDGMTASVPANRRADVAFAKISLSMRGATDADRDAITARMQAFRKDFPNDRRVAALLTEVATLYDNLPKRKEAMLNEALIVARTEEMRSRIHDDLKRISLLKTPITLRGTTADDKAIDIESLRGRVVLIYFFANWSPPSIAALEEVHYLRRTFPENEVAVVGVSLDASKEALAALNITNWPVLWDGKGWMSPMVRNFGINALPTLWILDRKGALRTLNAKTESEALIRSIIKEG